MTNFSPRCADWTTPDWAFDSLLCEPVHAAQRLIPGEQGVKAASRLGRFVRYPSIARAATRDPDTRVFHVLDHSHANLTLSLPPAKSVLTCHDIIPYLAAKKLVPIPAGRVTKYTFPMRIHCMRRCRRVIAISESTKRDLVQHAGIPADRIDVVYYGVNPAFRPVDAAARAARRRELLDGYGIPSDARVLLHVGTATRYKNTPLILRALAQLGGTPRSNDETFLLRVGAPFFDDEETLIDSLGIRNRIVHAGRIFNDILLADHYRSADIFVFPSLWEGFGWPPLEAMACGTPVITSNIASLPEVVGDAGIAVAPDDLTAFVGAIQSLLTDDARRADLSARSIKRAARFTWEQCAHDTLSVYKRVVESTN